MNSFVIFSIVLISFATFAFSAPGTGLKQEMITMTVDQKCKSYPGGCDDDNLVTVHLRRGYRRERSLEGILHLRFEYRGRTTERSFQIR